MFGKNEVVGRSYFNGHPSESLIVTSMFYTLQGEGPYRGKPAFFIRLAKCNLSCSFCDTYFDRGEIFTFSEIMTKIENITYEFYSKRNIPVPLWAKGNKRDVILVITGGEPTLQTNLVSFLRRVEPYFKTSQIETNGILYLDVPEYTTYVVSPKCAEDNMGPIKYMTPHKDVIRRASCFKFVMSADGSAYSHIPDWAIMERIDNGKEIFISPMNVYLREPAKAKALHARKPETSFEERSTVDEVISFWEPGLLDMEKNRKNHEYAADYCMRHGCTLNLQVHLFASLP